MAHQGFYILSGIDMLDIKSNLTFKYQTITYLSFKGVSSKEKKIAIVSIIRVCAIQFLGIFCQDIIWTTKPHSMFIQIISWSKFVDIAE